MVPRLLEAAPLSYVRPPPTLWMRTRPRPRGTVSGPGGAQGQCLLIGLFSAVLPGEELTAVITNS